MAEPRLIGALSPSVVKISLATVRISLEGTTVKQVAIRQRRLDPCINENCQSARVFMPDIKISMEYKATCKRISWRFQFRAFLLAETRRAEETLKYNNNKEARPFRISSFSA